METTGSLTSANVSWSGPAKLTVPDGLKDSEAPDFASLLLRSFHSVEPASEGEDSAGSILLLVAETVSGVWQLVGCPLLGRTDRNTSVLQSVDPNLWICSENCWTGAEQCFCLSSSLE